ncbi:DNA primase DnaG [Salinirubrum litoreum]|uniref:DNA primase DnaG n=1 Tax=Salinirubrum litoreum TaxID=1126234 RepID=A0ABD5RCU4_9EURY|nr:DNA primase DnaG [Salinirubrum litoreum]
MDDTSKYLIHADIAADGVVERSDVVGAIFGQTEGLLGDDLDLRDLQQSSKVGRIDVQIDSENGQSHGTVTIASSLDKVETAILAASLETITRVGPCRATIEVADIEDVRAAKRREVVERAKQLLTDSFDDSVMDSREILDEVREAVRVEDITEYAGLPAGPHVADSDAIIVVEGRADVLTLLKYGIKNAIAVEGTNVPEAVADLTAERTVTAFLDGDRGGELILRELAQVGDVDHVAFAPSGKSVEDLARHEVMSALRDKIDYATLVESGELDSAGSAEPTDAEDTAHPRTGSRATTESPAADTPDGERVRSETGVGAVQSADTGSSSGERVPTDAVSSASTASTTPTETSTAQPTTGHSPTGTAADDESTTAESVPDDVGSTPADGAEGDTDSDESTAETASDAGGSTEETTSGTDESAESGSGATDADASDAPDDSDSPDTESTATLRGHVSDVIDGELGVVRLLGPDLAVLDETDAGEAFTALESSDPVPFAVVLDGPVSQRLLDVAAQRGVDHLIGESTEQYVKKPVSVRVRTAEQLRAS